MLLGLKRGSPSSSSVGPSSDQQLESHSSHRKGNHTPTVLYMTLLSLSCPCQYFLTFYYISKSTSSSFLSIIKILNQIIITTLTRHQVSAFQTIRAVKQHRHYHSRNCRNGLELLPRTSLPSINTTQLRDHAITPAVLQS